MEHLANRETIVLLEQWAIWAKQNKGLNINWQSVSATAGPQESDHRDTTISDDLALIIDGLMGKLIKRNPKLGNVLYWYYLSEGNASKVARVMGLNRKEIASIARSGEVWFDLALEVILGEGA
ncbi:antiterminator Q family protein [Marinicellulosiphila megalodicopiae]|uniref:antiterminator Q family protein n=1 Tax=Marinicellulosiphila megalodicopiae TaxID=2724896 RepID=UPI003BAE26A3